MLGCHGSFDENGLRGGATWKAVLGLPKVRQWDGGQ